MRRPSFLFRCKIRLGKTRIPFGEKQISGGFMLRDARFKRVFRKCEEKPKTAEHTPIFGNKTADRRTSKPGPGGSAQRCGVRGGACPASSLS